MFCVDLNNSGDLILMQEKVEWGVDLLWWICRFIGLNCGCGSKQVNNSTK